ncbi:hypothetical protein HNO89_004352 [Sporosarcina luteola]|nr:hypothetical protein [Sporosarcina luteola]
MKKKCLMYILTLLFLLPFAQPARIEAASLQFKDVPKQHPSYAIIHEMQQAGYISGYPDGTFRPSNKISRKHVAALLDKALKLPPPSHSKVVYKDVPKQHPYFSPIMKLTEAGIMSGGPDGKFNPEAPMTRIQLAKVLDLAFGFQASDEQAFTDVTNSHWGYRHANAMFENGVLRGSKGKLEPNRPVTREYYTVALQRAIHAKNSTNATSKVSKGEAEKLTRDLSAAIERIIVEGVSKGKPFNELRPSLLKVATVEFTDQVLQAYYPHACNECDNTLFPYPTSKPSIRFEVAQPSADVLSVKTIELGNGLTVGGFVSYQFEKEGGTWKLASFGYQMVGKQNFQLTADEAKIILENDYRSHSQNVMVKLLSVSKRTGQDIVTKESFTYNLYLFDVKTDQGNEKVYFHSYNGYYPDE